jgi:Spy/CpxP family protein refolding chaperone
MYPDMMKTIGIMVLMMTLTTSVFAQKARPRSEKVSAEKRIEQRVKHMKKELNLTDEQTVRVSKLMKEQSKKQKALAKQMKANRKDSKTELKSILTQEQYIKLLEKQAQRNQRHQRRGARG